jgi:membrane protein DedA with SNARE-associated domain
VTEGIADHFLWLGSNPVAIALLIFATTFILEDLATVGAALLAAEGTISPSFALSALMAGIFLGDLALYGIGAAARTQSWARRFIGEERMARGRTWLERRYVPSLVAARFVPGLRLPTFAASGFLHLPFLHFFIVAAVAGFVWTTGVFALLLSFGTMALDQLGNWRWIIALLLVLIALIGPKLVERSLMKAPTND